MGHTSPVVVPLAETTLKMYVFHLCTLFSVSSLNLMPSCVFAYNVVHSGKLIPDEQRLLNKVFRSYDNSVRPVYNATHNVVVRFGLTLIQIMDMVSNFFPILFIINISINHNVQYTPDIYFNAIVALFMVSNENER